MRRLRTSALQRQRLYALIKAIRERRRKAFAFSPFADHRLPECAGMSLDHDERLRSDAEVKHFLKSVAPAS